MREHKTPFAPYLFDRGFRCNVMDCVYAEKGARAAHHCNYASITGKTKLGQRAKIGQTIEINGKGCYFREKKEKGGN